MSSLAQYLENNKKAAYDYATKNTPHNASGRPVISKDDEWHEETEWDDLFLKLSKQTKGEN